MFTIERTDRIDIFFCSVAGVSKKIGRDKMKRWRWGDAVYTKKEKKIRYAITEKFRQLFADVFLDRYQKLYNMKLKNVLF